LSGKGFYGLAALSGFFVGGTLLTDPQLPTHYLLFLCLVPLWLAWWPESSGRRIFLGGWLTQFIFTLIGFSWISHTVREFSHLSAPVSLLVLVLYAALAHLHIPLAGWIWWKLFFTYPAWVRLLALPLITNLFERVMPMIFDWHLGYAWFFLRWPGFHLADTIGFIGLSAVALLMNAALLGAWLSRRNSLKWIRPLAAGGLLLAMVAGAAKWRESSLVPPNEEIKVMVVQANIGNRLKHLADHGARFREAITEQYLSLTAEGLSNNRAPDFVLWPETSFPGALGEGTPTSLAALQLRNFFREKQMPLLVGAYSEVSDGRLTNALYFLSPEGKHLAAPYAKSLLLPFGEYIPGAEMFPRLKSALPSARDFAAGDGPTVVNLLGRKVGVQICYEGLFDWFSRGLAARGAEVIVNVTNDSWYGKWLQPSQHLYLTFAKAIEVRRPIVRATNTGYSAAITARGEILGVSPLHEEWAHTFTVPFERAPRLTPFVRFGFWLVPFFMTSTLLALFLFAKSRAGRDPAETVS
jgi:apolipoprotein N-acyltransferase